MQLQPTPAPLLVTPSGVLIVDGYGIRVFVEKGRLVVHDGIGRSRREARFYRATCPVRRLVLLGHTGFVTLEALRWLADVGVGLVQLDPDGRLLVASAGLGLDDPRLRRAQALASGTEAGMAAAVELLGAKLQGQASLVTSLPGGEEARSVIESCRPLLRLATTPAELMVPEAAAANAYWAAWSQIELRWAKKDLPRIPGHWRTLRGRTSPITGNARSAANPANAILNHLYALLEAQARLACLAMGLDPGLGVLHADLRARDSLALDVMEAVRPDVDAWFLGLIERRVFRRDDFHETRQGVCRILPPLTHELAETVVLWRDRLVPVVDRVAQRLMTGSPSSGRPLPTKLTQGRRSAGRGLPRSYAVGSVARVGPRRACATCGRPVPAAGRAHCDACLAEVTEDQRAAFISAGQAELHRQRDAGTDRSHGGDAGRRRGAKVAESRRAAAEWERSNGPAPDAEVFRREVLPLIQGHVSRDAGRADRPVPALLRRDPAREEGAASAVVGGDCGGNTTGRLGQARPGLTILVDSDSGATHRESASVVNRLGRSVPW
jgi:CRISPR-associated endonuclease Cas1